MILGEGNEKMSKSKGNVVNPDDIVYSHGADTLRLYEMFMGPLDASIAWNENGLDGARRFLDRVWRLLVNEETGEPAAKIVDKETPELDKVYNETVKKVTEDFESLLFNTGISQLMVFVNEAYKAKEVSKTYVENFVKLLSPVAPHIAEELWNILGNKETLAYAEWPSYDETKLVEDKVEIVVQINGKVKNKLEIARDLSKDETEKLAMADEKIKEELEGKTVRKVIVVPQKLVNIVAN